MNWQLPKQLSGTKETIKAKVAELQVSQPLKDFILDQVATLNGESAMVTITGYSQDHANAMHAGAITRHIQITISSVAL